MNVLDTARDYIELDRRVKELDAELKTLKAERDQLNDSLVDQMTDAEMQNLTIHNKTISLVTAPMVSANKEYEEDLFAALEDNGLADIIKTTVNANTLSGAVRELITQNDGILPDWLDGLVNVFTKTTARLTSAGKKK